MDIDRINDRIEALRELKSRLEDLEEDARKLDVELDMGSIMHALGLVEGAAALYYEADREALCRAYERMAL